MGQVGFSWVKMRQTNKVACGLHKKGTTGRTLFESRHGACTARGDTAIKHPSTALGNTDSLAAFLQVELPKADLITQTNRCHHIFRINYVVAYVLLNVNQA